MSAKSPSTVTLFSACLSSSSCCSSSSTIGSQKATLYMIPQSHDLSWRSNTTQIAMHPVKKIKTRLVIMTVVVGCSMSRSHLSLRVLHRCSVILERRKSKSDDRHRCAGFRQPWPLNFDLFFTCRSRRLCDLSTSPTLVPWIMAVAFKLDWMSSLTGPRAPCNGQIVRV